MLWSLNNRSRYILVSSVGPYDDPNHPFRGKCYMGPNKSAFLLRAQWLMTDERCSNLWTNLAPADTSATLPPFTSFQGTDFFHLFGPTFFISIHVHLFLKHLSCHHNWHYEKTVFISSYLDTFWKSPIYFLIGPLKAISLGYHSNPISWSASLNFCANL